MVERVSLYRSPSTLADADEIAGWLDDRFPGSTGDGDGIPEAGDGDATPEVAVRDRFLDVHRSEDLPTQFARARVFSPYDRRTGNTMLGTIRYEERALEDPTRAGGVLYDGSHIQSALNDALPAAESRLEHAHVVLLDRTVGTWGEHDGRWHKRVVVLGQPAIVSIPGLYEAPAKPEAYYKEKQRHALLSGDAPPREVLENRIEGDFLIEDDPRTTDALKGYVLQAVHYLATGEAFCEDERCRLFNAHYHEELVAGQLCEPEFCDEHASRYGSQQ